MRPKKTAVNTETHTDTDTQPASFFFFPIESSSFPMPPRLLEELSPGRPLRPLRAIVRRRSPSCALPSGVRSETSCHGRFSLLVSFCLPTFSRSPASPAFLPLFITA